MAAYLQQIGKIDARVQTYGDLHRFSVEHQDIFWSTIWDLADVRGEKGEEILSTADRFQETKFFPRAKLNFAENLLRRRDDGTALIFSAEGQKEATLSFAELYDAVHRMQCHLLRRGIRPGDVVAAFMPNMPETIICMLAATSLGAVWSSTSPDFGVQGVVDRFGQIRPRILCISDGYFFKGKPIDTRERALQILQKIDSVEAVVYCPLLGLPLEVDRPLQRAENLPDVDRPFTFERFSFQHPVYIMYSSGTTGLPKCMVQGPGVLLNHLKEHILHGDLRENGRIFYYTTCGWMMWNWLVSALAVGATLLLYDGNPFTPDADALFDWTDRHQAGTFGTSARYLLALRDLDFRPRSELEHLKVILSTGSPLPEAGFSYVYSHLKSSVRLSSISGGTDLNGCFALGNPVLPVRSGELQSIGLGMDVQIYNEAGQSVTGEQGELICARPFPSMPLYFWNDADGSKYHRAYFERFANVWCHGDFAMMTGSGGLVVYGRSDATLNPGGVRIGTADIYSIVDQFAEVADSVVVGLPAGDDVQVILFVRMQSKESLTEDLSVRIKKKLREDASPRHVPARIIEVPDIPYTLNMKKVELAVRRALLGEEVKNKEALQNPDSLRFYEEMGRQLSASREGSGKSPDSSAGSEG
ncbi:MAG: acetoacetate--CoA ligase [Spirochaetales bacterium]|nr:acetoacetate--CoA ligase [Spirochaetales bacterium]